MHVKRTATLVVLGGAAAAWLYAAATSGTRDQIGALPIRPQAIDARGAALASEIARLHERLRPQSTPRQPGRNLFSYTTLRQTAAPPATRAAVSEAVAPVPPGPIFKLIGIGEDASAEGPLRTAIISAPGQLFVVKAGDNVTPRYRVEKISADVVELSEIAVDGSTLRLALR